MMKFVINIIKQLNSFTMLKSTIVIVSILITFSCSVDKKEKSRTHAEPKSDSPKIETPVVNESTSVAKSSTEDWDEVLDSYESYTDDYIKILKKVKDGDNSVMAEYASLMQKGTEFSEKMQKAGNELTPEQLTRFTKIQTKLTEAAASMY